MKIKIFKNKVLWIRLFLYPLLVCLFTLDIGEIAADAIAENKDRDE